MINITCGHFDFIVRDSWILYEQQQMICDALVESYKELVAKAGTTDPEVLAGLANGNKNE